MTTAPMDHPEVPETRTPPAEPEAAPFSEETSGLLRALLESREHSVPTFSETLDYNLNGGLRRKTLIGIASPPGGGKTTFAWQLAQHIAEHGKQAGEYRIPVPCLYISLEMAKATLYNKALSRIGRIDGGMLSGRKWLTEEDPDVKDRILKDLTRANHKFERIAKHLRVLDVTQARPGRMTIKQIREEAKAFMKYYQAHLELDLMRGTPDPKERERLLLTLEHNPPLVIFVDHLQLLHNPRKRLAGDPIGYEAALSYDLKHLAVSMDCTVVALSRIASEEEHPVIQGADMTAVLRTGYSLIEEKIRALKSESREMESAAAEEREEIERERSEHQRLRSQKPLQTAGSPIYASLDIEKNREGRARDALFVWRRAFHEFEEVEVEEESRSFRRFLPGMG